MAHELIRDEHNVPLRAAGTIAQYRPVKLSPTAAETVQIAGTAADRVFGFVAGPVNNGEQVAVREEGNYVKAVAAASLGANTEVIVGSSDGSLIAASTAITASGHWVVGISIGAAAAGGVFTCYIKPRKVA